MSWTAPLVWWALLAIVVPIAIHLLAQQPTARTLFPSLRFLPAAERPLVTRHALRDRPLLIVRLLIVTAAVAASAGPLFSRSQHPADGADITRALVSVGSNDANNDRLAAERKTSARHATFQAPVVADAVRGAVEWMQRQPAAIGELVIVGDLRAGDLSGHDLTRVPPVAGIRFVAVPPLVNGVTNASIDAITAVAADGDGIPRVYNGSMHVNDESTRVRYGEGILQVHLRRSPKEEPLPDVRVIAPTQQMAHAEAVLRAVWRHGLLVSREPRPLTISFGRDERAPRVEALPRELWMRRVLERVPEVSGVEEDGRLLVNLPLAALDSDALSVVSRVLRATYEDLALGVETRPISATLVEQWSRPPGKTPVGRPPTDNDDRRWLWALTLALLLVEQLLRRAPRGAAGAPAAASSEARVA